jgi:hypothetical protein
MTFIAKVHNGTIAVPPEVALPEGAEVEVRAEIAPARPPSAEPVGDSNGAPDHAVTDPNENPFEWMRKYIGCIKDGPEDWAAEHDHYIHGTPKRGKR